MDASYRGIITALATPFDRDGQINETALCELIERNIKWEFRVSLFAEALPRYLH